MIVVPAQDMPGDGLRLLARTAVRGATKAEVVAGLTLAGSEGRWLLDMT